MRGRRGQPEPTGLPGEQQQARERRATFRRRASNGLLMLGSLALLTVLVGPTRTFGEPPPLGPAERDIVATRDFDDVEPIVDVPVLKERAAAQVAVHYAFDKDAVRRRTDAIHAAFRLVRPRWRLYLADRQRALAEAAAQPKAPEPKAHKGEPRRPEAPPPGARKDVPSAVAALDAAMDDELNRLRHEFESRIAVRRSEVHGEVFPTLKKHGFAEEVELLLSDVAQVLLSQRIVRDVDRFEDDLARGIYDSAEHFKHDRASARGKVQDVDGALRQAEEFVAEFVKQKKPSRFDDPLLQVAIKALARAMVEPTFARDLTATQAAEKTARDNVPRRRYVRYARGESLVKRGEIVTPEVQRRIARMQEGTSDDQTPRAYVATALLLALALALFAGFASRHLHHFRHRPRDAHLLVAILIVHAGVLRLLLALGEWSVGPASPITPEMWMVALPYALGPTLATLFLRPYTAAPFTVLAATLASLMALNAALLRANQGVAVLVGVEALVLGLAGVHAARHFRMRSDLVRSGVTIGGVSLGCSAAVALYTLPRGMDLLAVENGFMLLAGVASGALCYFLLAALTPIFESGFNRLTDIKLLELTSMNHPALRLLATEAPGTFTHSVMVGNLAQAGCDAIGANGLLARVGAYYHDLGKTRAPRYFAENQYGENPHDKLKPHLSALIIKSHVKDGIKILKDFGLPDEIIDFVPQHHGTSLIAHFYHRAARAAIESGDDISESDFRYPGPKPQRRETALLMLADAVEAAAKALPEPNPLRVQALVKKIIAGKLEDGQFDECDLTLRELAEVEQAFVKTVVGMRHTRPLYLPAPGQAPAIGQLGEGIQPSRTPMPDDIRRVAIMADGGVGARDLVVRPGRPPVSATSTADLPTTGDPTAPHSRLTRTEPGLAPPPKDDDGEVEGSRPSAPTAVVASRTLSRTVPKSDAERPN
jgi:putative nucleotidyltransferase with HDIG domain